MESTRFAGALLGTALLGGTFAASTAAAPDEAAATPSTDSIARVCSAEAEVLQLVSADAVEGTFSYDQETTTANEQIRDAFQKASATLCNVSAVYETSYAGFIVSVGGEVSNPFDATIAELADDQGTVRQVMSCSCTSNSAGGSAIATAEVAGVPIETIAARAGV